MSGSPSGVYLDASALVKLVIEEPESESLRRRLADASALYTSRIASVEVRRTVARQHERDAGEQVEALLAALRIVELDEQMSRAAAAAKPHSLRTLDAIHLASALALAEEIRALVAYDSRLAAAARDAGLEVLAPIS